MLPEGNKLNLLRDQKQIANVKSIDADACSADVTTPGAKVTVLRMELTAKQNYASIYYCTGVVAVLLVLGATRLVAMVGN